MYMIIILQLQAYRATGDSKYLDRAALEMTTYLEKLQQPKGFSTTRRMCRFTGDGEMAG